MNCNHSVSIIWLQTNAVYYIIEISHKKRNRDPCQNRTGGFCRRTEMKEMGNLHETQYFGRLDKEPENEAKRILMAVSGALREKGYNPVNQIVGYILSGDPTYITSHQNARALIRKLERDELLEELVKDYLVRNE